MINNNIYRLINTINTAKLILLEAVLLISYMACRRNLATFTTSLDFPLTSNVDVLSIFRES